MLFSRHLRVMGGFLRRVLGRASSSAVITLDLSRVTTVDQSRLLRAQEYGCQLLEEFPVLGD